MDRLKHWLGSGVIGLSVVVGALLGGQATALAHAELVKSSPAASSDIAAPPGQVQLWFSEKPSAQLTTIQVTNQAGARVDAGIPPVASNTEALSLMEPLKPNLARDSYSVAWRAVAADDGHVTSGTFAFRVGVASAAVTTPAAAGAAIPAPHPTSAGWATAVKWLAYLAASGLVGCLAFPIIVLEPVRQLAEDDAPTSILASAMARRCAWGARAFAAASLVVALVATVLEAQIIAPDKAGAPAGLPVLLQTGLGHMLSLRVALCAAGLVVLCFAALEPRLPSSPHRSLGATAARGLPVESLLLASGMSAPPAEWAAPGLPWRSAGLAGGIDLTFQAAKPKSMTWSTAAGLAFGLTLAELLTFSLSSHAAASPRLPQLAVLVDYLHLAAGSLWVGGLVVLCVALLPVAGAFRFVDRTAAAGDEATNRFFGAVIRQFSQLGLLATGAVAITGLFAAYKQLPDLALLTDTDFGRTLLVKVGIFALALAAAALHRLVLKPAISRARGTSANHIRRVFSRTLLLEAALALAVLAAAAVLTSTPSRPASVASGNATQHAATLAEANAEPRGASASIPIASIPVLATSTAPQAAPGGIPAVAPRSSRQ